VLGGRIPSPTGDLSQGIRVRGRWRRWATTALVVAGRAEAACYSTHAVLFTRYSTRAVLFTRTGGGGRRIRVGP
jgi:hypothetical protein